MDRGTRLSPVRFLAPLALIIVLVAFLAIVTSSGNNNSSSTDSSSGSAATTTTSSSTTTTSTKSKSKKSSTTTTASGPRVYIVKVGDTLGSIAAQTGIPLSTIQTLNPDVDPHAMVAGQRIKLR